MKLVSQLNTARNFLSISGMIVTLLSIPIPGGWGFLVSIVGLLMTTAGATCFIIRYRLIGELDGRDAT